MSLSSTAIHAHAFNSALALVESAPAVMRTEGSALTVTTSATTTGRPLHLASSQSVAVVASMPVSYIAEAIYIGEEPPCLRRISHEAFEKTKDRSSTFRCEIS